MNMSMSYVRKNNHNDIKYILVVVFKNLKFNDIKYVMSHH